MDVETRKTVEKLVADIRGMHASEVSLLNATIEALEFALGWRDWETVVGVKSALHKLADELATIDDKAS